MQISSLHIYPVKSSKMVMLAQSRVGPLGLEYDRRWMIVDAQGKFVTQREFQPLSQLSASPSEQGLRLTIGDNHIDVPNPEPDQRLDVSVWDSDVKAAHCGPEAEQFLQQNFGQAFTLVYHDTQTKRLVEPGWADPGAQVSFADGYPVLITTQASLEAINDALVEKGEQPVTMARFRPNIVISGTHAWAEDDWQVLDIGGTLFDLVKPCARCIMTTNDPETGERPNNEPMTTLVKLRRSPDKRIRGVLFGINAIPRRSAEIATGDVVSVIS